MDLLQPQLVIWCFLALAIVLVFIHPEKNATVLARTSVNEALPHTLFSRFVQQSLACQCSWIALIVALIVAVLLGRLQLLTTAALFVVFICVFLLKDGHKSWQIAVRHSLVVLVSLLLSLHLLPGFDNWQLLDQIQLSEQSRPFSLFLNLDKPLAFFLMLLLLPDLTGRYTLNFAATIKLICISLLAVAAMSLLALWAGFVDVEWKLPGWWWMFALNNLLFTCVVEEAFFRGYLQRLFTDKLGAFAAIVLVAVLFGLAHLAGGWLYALLATLAAIFYGYLYWRSGSLLVAVAGHFLLNIVHLFALTYPALR